MQPNGDAMAANLSPLARIATSAEVLDVTITLDHHGSAEGDFARLHDPAQQRRRPMGTEHLILLQVSPRSFHYVPPGGFAEQGFCEFTRHPSQYEAQRA
jgi:hypothetical protein